MEQITLEEGWKLFFTQHGERRLGYLAEDCNLFATKKLNVWQRFQTVPHVSVIETQQILRFVPRFNAIEVFWSLALEIIEVWKLDVKANISKDSSDTFESYDPGFRFSPTLEGHSDDALESLALLQFLAIFTNNIPVYDRVQELLSKGAEEL